MAAARFSVAGADLSDVGALPSGLLRPCRQIGRAPYSDENLSVQPVSAATAVVTTQ